ncbi:MAG: HlyD family secretion protein [Saprospiraceae bacterium]|jgi:HlyD family secretion protein
MASKKKSNLWIWIMLGVIVLLVGAVVMKNKNRETGEKVTAEAAEIRVIKETVTASGKVFPVTEVKISSDVSGEIVELYVEEGDSVVANQILAKIDADAYQSQVERGRASVNSSKANLANSRAQIDNARAQKEQIEAQLLQAREVFNRNKKLKDEGVISQVDFESAQTNMASLEANLRSADASISGAQQATKAAEFTVKSSEASLKELNTSLRRTTIYAPNSGVISLLNIEKGERVVGNGMMSGSEILRIADLNSMEVQVEVSENDIPRVTIGDDVEIEIDAYLDRKFKGKVVQIANSANNTMGVVALTSDQVTNFVVTINVEPSSYADLVTAKKPYPFRPGMSASVEIFTKEVNDALSVPIQAVTTREKDVLEGKKKDKDAKAKTVKSDDDDIIEIVFVVSGDTVRFVPVKTGIQDDDFIQVLSGLAEGDMVVTGPYTQVSKKLEQGDEVIMTDLEDLYEEKE